MQCALALAEQGVGLASPNPTVGCILVRDGRIVGRGFHQYEHRDHAEVVALKEAGEAARGATAYVTLEPCSHFGRTGPCARALTNAGVGRVVVATADPNPAVNGQGIAYLRNAGVEVTVGVLEREARALNDAFARFIRTRLPFVTLKAAVTLDGRIAPRERAMGRGGAQELGQTPPGAADASSPFWITGEAARAQVQEMRHANDALLTGIGTVMADDPLLTDRSERPRRRPLLRVVLDSQLKMPLSARLLANVADDLLVVTRSENEERRRELLKRGARLLEIDTQEEGGISLRALLAKLGEQNITSVMVEGGARINRSVLLSDSADKLCLFYAPTFLGADAVPVLSIGQQARWPRLTDYQLRRYGSDFAVEGCLRDPWA
jgi:diaminohydroxyphosphoribosylaminopyrimidine deaminase/5-amino-6-(5-phosphoribosylamino)uracil reductase